MNAKRIATGIISACAILGASLLISSDADGCSVDRDGELLVTCDESNTNNCSIKIKTATHVYTVSCHGNAFIHSPETGFDPNPSINP